MTGPNALEPRPLRTSMQMFLHRRRLTALVLTAGCMLATGCAPGFQITLPNRFVVLDDEAQSRPDEYRLRATTPDGVVVGVKSLDNRVAGTLEFWSEAVTRRLRDNSGYELLSEEAIRAANGQTGHLMRYGRDLQSHTYRYSVAVFVTESHIWVVEAGGREAAYAELESAIESSVNAMVF